MSVVGSVVQSVVQSVTQSVFGIVSSVRYFLGFDSVLNTYGKLEKNWQPTGSFKIKGKFSTTSTAEQWLYSRWDTSSGDERSIAIRYKINEVGFFVSIDGVVNETVDVSYVPVGKFSTFEATFNASTNIILDVDGVTATTTHSIASVYDADTPSYFGSKTGSSDFLQGVPANYELIDLDVPANSLNFALDSATANYELPVNNVTGSELYSFVDVGTTLASLAITQTGSGYSVTTSVNDEDRTYINFTTEVGVTYTVSGLQVVNTSGNDITWFVRNGSNGGGTIYDSTTSTAPSLVFTALSTTSTLLLDVGGNTAPLTYQYDNISVKQVTNALVYSNLPEANRFPAELVGLDWVGTTELIAQPINFNEVWTVRYGAGITSDNSYRTTSTAAQGIDIDFDKLGPLRLTYDITCGDANWFIKDSDSALGGDPNIVAASSANQSGIVDYISINGGVYLRHSIADNITLTVNDLSVKQLLEAP